MIHLSDKKCVACEGGVPALSLGASQRLLAELSDAWKFDTKTIHALFSFGSFLDGIKFVNTVATIAEAEGHHPDIDIRFNKIRVSLVTHAANGLTENDFIMAAKIDKELGLEKRR